MKEKLKIYIDENFEKPMLFKTCILGDMECAVAKETNINTYIN